MNWGEACFGLKFIVVGVEGNEWMETESLWKEKIIERMWVGATGLKWFGIERER